MTVLYLDTETFSPEPIKNGVFKYAESAEIMIAAWAVDDGPVFVDDMTVKSCRGLPIELETYINDPAVTVVFHKSDFDRTLIRFCWSIDIDSARIEDTLVRALAHGLPGGLDKLCDIFKIDEDKAKGKDGKALIQLFCKPLPKNSKLRRATRETHPAKWAEFMTYAGRDILAMRELRRLLPSWNLTPEEKALWVLDQKINDRGFAVDVALAEGAIAAVKSAQKILNARTRELTDDAVESAMQRDALLAHILNEHGVYLPDMKKDTLERRLADENLPEAVHELIRLRLATATTSTAKYAALLRSVSADGRLRGTLQFCGANRTGRWSGRLFQPQNLMRPDMPQPEIDFAIEALASGSADIVLDNIMRASANAMRGTITAGRDKKLVSADLANIEGRMAAWLAGEQWKLDAFAAYDAKTGPDLYVMAYARAFGVTPESVLEDYAHHGSQRQVGKVMELGLGYEGAINAFLSFAAVYRLDLEAMAEAAYDHLDEAVRDQAEGMLAWRKRKDIGTFGLSDRAFIVCQVFVSLWREAHPEISSYWPELNSAAKKAIQNPGWMVPCRKLVFVKQGAWLRMILPSGRSVCYPSPRIEEGKITYLGVNQYTRQWGRLSTYGGKLFENACQALARDVMAWNMPAIEDEGFEIILTVHDDVIAEAPAHSNRLTSDYLSALLSVNPPWLPGCPLAAGGFEADRYRKD